MLTTAEIKEYGLENGVARGRIIDFIHCVHEKLAYLESEKALESCLKLFSANVLSDRDLD